MNKKPTILAVAALGSLALIGTGFAGWVIVANATSAASGNITAYEVTDNRLTATGKWGEDRAADSGSIVFGKPKPADATADSPWFKTKGEDMLEEKLSDTYTLSIESKNNGDTATVKVSAKLTITEHDTTNKPYAAAFANHWITAPTLILTDPATDPATDLFKSSTNSAELTLSAGKATAKFAFTFAWGSHFGGKNPFTYYNDDHNPEHTIDGTNKTYGNDAAEVMGALGKINETKFSIAFTIERVDAA
jgi:hypothetical protein